MQKVAGYDPFTFRRRVKMFTTWFIVPELIHNSRETFFYAKAIMIMIICPGINNPLTLTRNYVKSEMQQKETDRLTVVQSCLQN